MSVRTDWHTCKHILAVRLDGMGEVIMTTPALRALRAAGATRITLLGSPAGTALTPFIPEIDDAQACEVAWMKNGANGNGADLGLVGRLRALRPDAAVIFTVNTQSALPAAVLCHLAGIPRILAHCRENPYRIITHWVREDEGAKDGADGMRHEVLRQLDLVAVVGADTADRQLSFHVHDTDHADLDAVLAGHGVTEPSGWIAVHAGTGVPSRRYPPQKLIEALAALQGESRQVVLLGGGDVAEIRNALEGSRKKLTGLIDLSGKLSLGALAAALQRASVFICHHSGPAHIAAALGTPVVDLYAVTNPQNTSWGRWTRVLNSSTPCHSCLRSVCPRGHHECLTGAAPVQVVHAAREWLGNVSAGAERGI